MRRDHITDEIRKEVHYLYHSYKNENMLVYVILLMCIIIFTHNGWFTDILIFILYLIYCSYNNACLDRNPKIIQQRKYYMNKYGIGRDA